MKINTFSFGEIDVAEDQVIRFEHGIPGFEHVKEFTIVAAGEESPFHYLQSMDNGDVTFIVCNPFAFFPEYEFDLTESTLVELKIASEGNVEAWSIVTFKDNVEDTTMNLMAPIIINAMEKLGKQIILHDTGYATKHKLFQETPAAAAGSKE